MSDDREPITQPMLETLLDRIKKLEEVVSAAIAASTTRLETELTSVRADVNAVRADVSAVRAEMNTGFTELRAEMNAGFTALRDEMSVMGDDARQARARQKDLFRRIEELESKAS